MDSAHEITIDGYTLSWDDTWQRLVYRGRVLSLSPTQYRICRAFLLARSTSPTEVITAHATLFILGYIPGSILQEKTEIVMQGTLYKHISRLNWKLERFAFHIDAFQDGYLLTVSSLVSPVGAHHHHA